MKFKLMKVFFLVLLAVLAVSAVCAADNNATDEIVSMETNQSYDEISLENFDSEQINEIDLNRTEKSDEKMNLWNRGDSTVILLSWESISP